MDAGDLSVPRKTVRRRLRATCTPIPSQNGSLATGSAHGAQRMAATKDRTCKPPRSPVNTVGSLQFADHFAAQARLPAAVVPVSFTTKKTRRFKGGSLRPMTTDDAVSDQSCFVQLLLDAPGFGRHHSA